MKIIALSNYFLILLLSPLLLGIANRTKAFFAGRSGPSVAQLYYDLIKLFNKGAVYSKTTTWIFRASPLVGVAAVLTAMAFIPFGKTPALFSFPGDVVLVIYFLALMRFFTVLGALDTGSSFEGMGASREVQFAVFAEPALFLALAALIHMTGSFSLSGIYSGLGVEAWMTSGGVLALVAGSFFIVFLAENSRMPVDDPNTHLELTMIHEVMVLDHGGMDLGFILYSAALKFWILGFLLAGLIIPVSLGKAADTLVFCGAMFLLAVIIGVVESVTARVRLIKVPNLLIAALSLAILALIFEIR